MKNKELIDGIYAIGEWIFELTKVGDDDEETDENRHILYFYKVLDELDLRLRTNKFSEEK